MLNWEGTMTPSNRTNTVRDWARKRASKSDRPSEFWTVFERTTERIVKEGEGSILDRPLVWQDATRVAAEIEALASRRALDNWGTLKGTCHPWLRHKTQPELAA